VSRSGAMHEKNWDSRFMESLQSIWFYQKILTIPEGISRATFANRLYIVTKATFNNGSSLKLFAEEAGGTDYISLNLYKTREAVHVKPCEQPIQKSLNFLREAKFL